MESREGDWTQQGRWVRSTSTQCDVGVFLGQGKGWRISQRGRRAMPDDDDSSSADAEEGQTPRKRYCDWLECVDPNDGNNSTRPLVLERVGRRPLG